MRPSSGGVSDKEYRPRIERVLEYIGAHCDEDLSLDRLAQKACVSKYHFHRIFQALVGETAGSYVRRIRLEQAARQLAADPTASMAQIAGRCGFSSSQNFARSFTAHFGCSPTSYRKDPASPSPASQPAGLDANGGKAALAAAIRELPVCRVAYIRDVGAFFSPSNAQAFDRLLQWAGGERNVRESALMPIAADWSDPATTSADGFVFDACLAVSENVSGGGEVAIQDLPGGLYAVWHCEVELDAMPDAVRRFCRDWLPSSGYRRDARPFLTIYYNNPNRNPRKLAIVDMCLPIRAEKVPYVKNKKY